MDETYENVFYQALRIRMVEEKIIELYPSDKIQSPVHLSIGQEHHVAAICAQLRKDDAVFSSYRCHAVYLAKGGDLRSMFSELYGRKTGISGGKAGSMHLCSPEAGMFGSSAVVASTLPHALGMAYANRITGRSAVAVSITGDGSTEEGVFHECLNFAALRRVPLLFVIENNGLAIHARLASRQAFGLSSLAAAFRIPYAFIDDGSDIRRVYDQTFGILETMRERPGPALLEIATYRYLEHVGIRHDFDKGYRSLAECEAWRRRDPLLNRPELIEKLRPKIREEIDRAVQFAEHSPVPGREDLLMDVDAWN